MKLFKLFYNYLRTRSVLKIRIKIKNDRNRVSWKRSRLDFGHAYFGGRGKKITLVGYKTQVCKRAWAREERGNGCLTMGGGVSLTYITVQIFNCIFSIVKQRQGVPYGPYQSHVRPLSSCSFVFDERARRRMATLQTRCGQLLIALAEQ